MVDKPHFSIHCQFYAMDKTYQLFYGVKPIGPRIKQGWETIPADNYYGYQVITKERNDTIALHELFGLPWSD